MMWWCLSWWSSGSAYMMRKLWWCLFSDKPYTVRKLWRCMITLKTMRKLWRCLYHDKAYTMRKLWRCLYSLYNDRGSSGSAYIIVKPWWCSYNEEALVVLMQLDWSSHQLLLRSVTFTALAGRLSLATRVRYVNFWFARTISYHWDFTCFKRH